MVSETSILKAMNKRTILKSQTIMVWLFTWIIRSGAERSGLFSCSEVEQYSDTPQYMLRYIVSAVTALLLVQCQ